MNSEVLKINNTDQKTAAALALVDAYIYEAGLTGKKALHLRLLTEETLGMVKAMTGDFNADFWIENKDDEYRIRLTADTVMDLAKKKDLLSVSSSGRNTLVKGLMGKVGDIIENGILGYTDVVKLNQQYGGGYVDYGYMGLDSAGDLPVGMTNLTDASYIWSLSNYKNSLQDASAESDPAKAAWDELEKSIVAKLAKDVLVGVKKDKVEMTIVAK